MGLNKKLHDIWKTIRNFCAPYYEEDREAKRKGWITAKELMEKLERDPEYQRRCREEDERLRVLGEELEKAEKPLVEDLHAVGEEVESVWDLVNTARPYPAAIPVLVAHLSRPYPNRIRAGIARALTEPYAGQEAYRELVKQFKQQPESNEAWESEFKWTLGNAISVVAKKENFGEVVDLIRNNQDHRTTRDMMVLRLSRLDKNRALDVIIGALDDKEISALAIKALAKYISVQFLSRIINVRPKIKQIMATHPEKWVRKTAQKILAKIDENFEGTHG